MSNFIFTEDEDKNLRNTLELVNENEKEFLERYLYAKDNYFNTELPWDVQKHLQVLKDTRKGDYDYIMKILSDPYEGRIRVRENDVVETDFFVGYRQYNSDGSYHGVDNILIQDWKSPVGKLFREKVSKRRPYDVLLNRVIELDGDKYVRHYEVFDNRVSVTGEKVEEVSKTAVDRQVIANRRRSRILTTLSEAQNKVIDSSKDINIVINGVPGSGKTIIGAYRLSKIAYDSLDAGGQNIIYVAPSEGVLNYFRPYFDVLGDTKVGYRDYFSVFDGLFAGVGRDKKQKFLYYKTDKFVDLLNDENFIDEILNLSEKKGFSDISTLRSDLDEIINNLQHIIILGESEKKYLRELVYMFMSQDEVSNANASDIKRLNINYRKNASLLREISGLFFDNFGISTITRENIDEFGFTKKKLQKVVDLLERFRKYRVAGREESLKIDEYSFSTAVILLNKLNDSLETTEEIEFLVDTDAVCKTLNKTIDYLQFNVRRSISAKEATLKDETSRFNHISHVFIDEGQDLTLMEYAVLKRIYKNATFTICGDVNQSNGKLKSQDSWDSIVNLFEADFMTMNSCYRSTRSIVELMNSFMTIDNYGKASSVFDEFDGRVLSQYNIPKVRSKEIFTFASKFDSENSCCIYINESTKVLIEANPFFSRFNVLRAEDIKGLEFDNIILFDYDKIHDAPQVDKFRYTLFSRAVLNFCIVQNEILTKDIVGIDDISLLTRTDNPFNGDFKISDFTTWLNGVYGLNVKAYELNDILVEKGILEITRIDDKPHKLLSKDFCGVLGKIEERVKSNGESYSIVLYSKPAFYVLDKIFKDEYNL